MDRCQPVQDRLPVVQRAEDVEEETMSSSFKLKLLFCLTLALNALGGAAWAWEFSMAGEFLWKGRFVGQLGSKGFFGRLQPG